jgi:hypothetical protein
MSASLAPECTEPKEFVLIVCETVNLLSICRRYDSCFLKWYSESMLFGPSTTGASLTLLQNIYGAMEDKMSAQNCSKHIKGV